MAQATLRPTPPEADAAQYFILGTAGHIDHGKTSLVRALTGTDTDRLPEEQKRGMTIELGFAELSVGRLHFGVVDVPGHEKFVRTMVAGATGIDLALLVVAGDDSVMPQTVEHVDILRLTGVQRLVVALTKSDLVDDVLRELVTEDVRSLLDGAGFADAPIVPVSSVTGFGLDELRAALARVAQEIPPRVDAGPFHLAIDRVFTVAGRGTVVTGSVLRGRVRSGDTLTLHPGEHAVRVRDLQTHGQFSESLRFGQRAALNIVGVDRDRLTRGCELATPGYLAPSRRLDVRFEAIPSLPREIRSNTRLRICMGTREILARITTLDHQPIAPSGSAFAQIRASEPLFGTFGRRFIARTENDSRTIGGGVVIRPFARRLGPDRAGERTALGRLERGSERDRLAAVLAEIGFGDATPLELFARTAVDPDRQDDLLREIDAAKLRVTIDGTDRKVPVQAIDRLFDRADRRLQSFHRSHPDEPGCLADSLVGWFERVTAPNLGRLLFERYLSAGRAISRGRFVCLPEFAPKLSAQDETNYALVIRRISDAAFRPPSAEELARALDTGARRVKHLLKTAVAFGDLVQIDAQIYLTPEREQQLRDTIRSIVVERGGATVSDVRERLDSTRKYTVPMLEYLDRSGFTRRTGDTRSLANGPDR